MKFYTISSTEYEANLPDFFIMDADGNYYGVSCKLSYAEFNKFPKDISFWRTFEGSDGGRHFVIDEVDLDESIVHEFDAITKEHNAVMASRPQFDKEPPVEQEFRTKKEYEQAHEAWWTDFSAWLQKVNMREHLDKQSELFEKRIILFASFSKRQREALLNYHVYRELILQQTRHETYS